MGGDGHHGHAHYTVPKPEVYKIENCPQLVEVQNALKRRGLRDPWLRNEVWRYDPKLFGTHGGRAFKFFTRGIPLGFGAFLLTIGAEYAFGYYDQDHGHGHDHH